MGAVEVKRLLEENRRVYFEKRDRTEKIPVFPDNQENRNDQGENQTDQHRSLRPERLVNRGILTGGSWDGSKTEAEPETALELLQKAQWADGNTLPEETADMVSQEIQRLSKRYGQDMEGWRYDQSEV